MTCGVYCIKAADGLLYVGSSCDIEQRVRGYRYSYNAGRKLRAALAKGPAVFSILEECERAKLLEREQFHIERIDPSLNSARYPHRHPRALAQVAAL